MSKQRWITAVLMVALAAVMGVTGEARQSSAAVTSLTFNPSAIALEGDGAWMPVNIVVDGLAAGEADTVQIHIEHDAEFTIDAPTCGPLYTGGSLGVEGSPDLVPGGTVFTCSLQNGPLTDASNIVASFNITKHGETTGERVLKFVASGGFKTTFYQAGSEVSPGFLGSLSVWDLLEDVTDPLPIDEGASSLVFNVTSTSTGTIPTLTHSVVSGPNAGSFIGFVDNLDNTGTFTITPTFGDAGVYTIEVAANNGTVTGTETFTLTVNDVNSAPVLAAIGDQSVDEGASLNVPISASDVDGDGLVFTATIQKGAGPIVTVDGSGFAAINDNPDGTGSLDFKPWIVDSGIYSVVVTVTDDSLLLPGALQDSETFTLTVNDVTWITAPAGTVKLQGVWDSTAPLAEREDWFANVSPLVELIRVSDGLVEDDMPVNPDGSFAFPGVSTDTNYRLRISAAGYFAHELGTLPADEIDVSLGDFDLGPLAENKPVTMLGGPVIPGFQEVNGGTIAVILGSPGYLGTSPDRLDTLNNVVDINGDGFIGGADVSIAISNMGLSGDQPWL